MTGPPLALISKQVMEFLAEHPPVAPPNVAAIPRVDPSDGEIRALPKVSWEQMGERRAPADSSGAVPAQLPVNPFVVVGVLLIAAILVASFVLWSQSKVPAASDEGPGVEEPASAPGNPGKAPGSKKRRPGAP